MNVIRVKIETGFRPAARMRERRGKGGTQGPMLTGLMPKAKAERRGKEAARYRPDSCASNQSGQEIVRKRQRRTS